MLMHNKYTIITECKYGPMAFYKTDDPIGTCLYYYGEWAEQEFDVIDKLVTTESNCIDLGANIGTHTVWLSKRCHRGYVFSIEPQFYIFQLLNTNIILNDATNCIPTNSFIMNYNGTERMVALIAPPEPNIKINYGEFNIRRHESANGIKTNVMKLDDLDLHDKKIDFIKMDCEGSEKEVLLSGHDVITKNKPHMYLEFNGKEGNDEVLYALNDLGYTSYWHVYTKFNKNNFKNNDINVYLSLDQQDTVPTIELIDKFFEGNIICIHKDNDISFDEKALPGDNIIKYLLKHKMISE